ncbi:MAG: PHP domain-containing protein [Clostridia bacterium]|nr:PHP domain-containing protein [Clostridia bacterium]MDD3832091.1 PHP domain-containing protein [Clostridia bacterium]
MILSDLHCHTKYSDGKGTVEEMVDAARKVGLKQLGITDHGLGHIAFGTSVAKLYQARECIDRLNAQYDDIEILLGIEANIYDSNGDLDLQNADMGVFDYIVAGFHQIAKPKNILDYFRYNLRGIIPHHRSAREIKSTTRAFCNAINNSVMNAFTHPFYGLAMEIAPVAKAAINNGVFIELNGKKVSMTDEQVLEFESYGVDFLLSSDAHSPDRVGDVSVPLSVVERVNLDKSRIVNWEKTVKLTKRW